MEEEAALDVGETGVDLLVDEGLLLGNRRLVARLELLAQLLLRHRLQV